jgi:hypothetical protein
MAAKNFGTVHVYGINGTVTSATVQGFNRGDNHSLEDETIDENGHVIEVLLDDVRVEATITLRIQSAYSESAIGGTLTYDSVEYIIMGKTRAEENRGFVSVEYTLRTYEYTASS